MSLSIDANTVRPRRPVQSWLPAFFLIALGVGAIGIGLNHLLIPSSAQHDAIVTLAGREYADVQLASFDRNPLLIRSHAAIGTLFVVLAAFQFWPQFRRRNPRIHKIMGYGALTCLVLLPASGVLATFVYPFAGIAGVIPNVVWMIAIVFCVARAWTAIRGHDVIDHEAWITRATAMTLGITLSRLYAPLLVMGFHVDSRTTVAVVFWLGQGEGLIAAEFWLRRPGGPLQRRAARMAVKGVTTGRRRHLKLSMPAGRGLSLRIVERPGLSLRPEALKALCDDLHKIARAVLPSGELHYGVLGGEHDRLDNSVITIIYDKHKAPVAFNALALMDVTLGGQPVEMLHLGLVMVDPALRGRGLSELLYGLTCVLLFLRRQCRPMRLSNVTQVPAVFGMVSETFDSVFPTPEHASDPDFAHRTLARQIMERHRHVFGVGPEATFDEEHSVILNSYTGGSDDLKKTFDDAAKHRREIYNDFCRGALDYDRGDDVLQIGQINMAAAARYLSRIARPKSAPWLAGSLLLFAIRSAVLPLVYWLDDDQQWGSLRAWKSEKP